MRVFWSVVLAAGLALVGLDVYESRQDSRLGDRAGGNTTMEDGTGFPSPNGPPPPPPR
jgi:hypothetical protein